MSSERETFIPDFIGGSYAVRLGLALSLAVVVMIVFGAIISVQASGELQSDVQQDLVSMSETQATQLDAWVETTQRDVRTTSEREVFASGDTESIKAELDELIEDDEVPRDVVGVHYLNTNTMEIESSSNDAMIGLNTRDQGAAFATDPPTFDGPGDTYVTEPFNVPAVDHPVVAIISPVEGDSNHALVFMTDLDARAESISGQQSDTQTVVVNDDGRYVAHPNSSKIMTSHDGGGMDVSTMEPGENRFMDQGEMLMGMTRLESTDWTVMVHSQAETAYALSTQINSDLIGLVLLAIINLGLVGVTIGSSTIISLNRLTNRAEQMGRGDLDVDLTTTRSDEFASLYGSFDDMRSSLRSTLRDAESAQEDAEAAKQEAEDERAQMEEMTSHLETKATEYGDVLSGAADGDLTGRVDPQSRNDAMSSVGEEINATLTALESTVADTKSFAQNVIDATDRVGTNADRVDQASQQVSQSITEIFEGTTEQSERLENAASEMENLSAAAEEMAASAQQVATTSQSAASVGEEGRGAAQEAIEEMNAIESETAEAVHEINTLDDDLDEIGEIVSLITDIVEQTNMLALNASIEAAHADGQGAGFAVVADEIKGLAEETKEAAGDIEARIERIQSQANDTVSTMEATSDRITDGVSTVQEAVEALERIVEYTEEVDTGIQDIDEATESQAQTAVDLLEMVDELTAISQQTATEADTVAGAADDQEASINEVSNSTTDLRQQADELESLLARFDVSTETGSTTTDAATGEGD